MTTLIEELESRVQAILRENFNVSRFESSIESPGRLVVRVVSPTFDGVDDVERQVQVWKILRENLSEDELLALEYVFTEGEKDGFED